MKFYMRPPGMTACRATCLLLIVSLASCKHSENKPIVEEQPMSIEIQPEAPDTAAVMVDPPPVKSRLSVATVPVRMDLAPLFLQADQSLQRRFSKSANPCKGVRYKFSAERGDLMIDFNDSLLSVRSRILYGASATYCGGCVFGNCVVPKITASCGTNGESKRMVRILANSKISVLPDYHLFSDFTIKEFTPENRCRVFFFDYDITDRVMKAARPPFENVIDQINTKVGSISIKDEVAKIWKEIGKPHKVADLGYLNMNPKSLSLSQMQGENKVLSARIGLTAYPFIGPTPQVVDTPLPDLDSINRNDGFNLEFDVVVPVERLSAMANTSLKGKEIDVAGRKFAVEQCAVSTLAEGKLALKVDFSGTLNGSVYLVGTPTVGKDGASISFPDLKFDAKTDSYLARLAEWLLNEQVVVLVRDQVVLDFTKDIGKVREDIQGALNGPLGSNVVAEGKVSKIGLAAIYPTRKSIVLRSILKGDLSVMISTNAIVSR